MTWCPAGVLRETVTVIYGKNILSVGEEGLDNVHPDGPDVRGNPRAVRGMGTSEHRRAPQAGQKMASIDMNASRSATRMWDREGGRPGAPLPHRHPLQEAPDCHRYSESKCSTRYRSRWP